MVIPTVQSSAPLTVTLYHPDQVGVPSRMFKLSVATTPLLGVEPSKSPALMLSGISSIAHVLEGYYNNMIATLRTLLLSATFATDLSYMLHVPLESSSRLLALQV